MIRPRPWIDALARHAHSARERPDPEHVHQLRVAAGRLVVWLRLARRRALRDDLRWLRRGAARVRDLDVLLAQHGAETWSAALVGERREAAAALHTELASARLDGLLQALEYLPALDEARARKRLSKLRAKADDAAAQAFSLDPPRSADLHTLRKRVRGVRYALEWMGQPSSPEQALQDELGRLRDAEAARLRARSAGAALGEDAAPESGHARKLWRAITKEGRSS
ncbi:MAG: CHAD domain-containing protein [Planctomycetes bacterium]|nr:CHAD domain-containing protein [Planctomycetota bacterium]